MALRTIKDKKIDSPGSHDRRAVLRGATA